jgi:hypothetical protein
VGRAPPEPEPEEPELELEPPDMPEPELVELAPVPVPLASDELLDFLWCFLWWCFVFVVVDWSVVVEEGFCPLIPELPLD